MWQRGISNLIRKMEGSVALMSALGLMALVGAASLALDMGHLYTVRNEIQNTADAAALAAASNLIKDQGGVAVRDSYGATQSAMTVAQTQSTLQGLPEVSQGDRNDVTVIFGEWNIYAGDPSTAWTEIGSTCGSYSNANAVKVTLKRASGMNYGPVTNLFAGIFGGNSNTSEVQATAIAYLGYTNEVQTGTVQVPLALPNNILIADNGQSGWLASFFAPREAWASTTKTLVFKDTGGCNVNNTVDNSPTLDSNQPYLFTVNPGDAVPDTIWNTLEKIYNPSKTASTPVRVGDLKRGQEIYARSEFKYGNAYIGPIFQRLQWAYNYKTTGNKNTAPAPGTTWRVTFPVYGMTPVASQPRKIGFMSLARVLIPFWPSEVYACYTVPPPRAIVNGFVNADITGVTYNGSSDDGSYTYPKTINGIKYNNKKDFLTRYPTSTWNANTVTIKNLTDGSTVSPPGSMTGGPPSNKINQSAPTNVGALATIPRLVK
jgi:Flp pilus assembly protein TadG